jgi:predicted acyltransferase (DUF342 family)
MKQRLHTAACLLACLLLASCGVNSPITVEDGTTVEGDRTTVNGGIFIGADCTVKGDCRTVNGPVSVGPDSRVQSLKSVNGPIKLDDDIVVDGDLETVNGGIRIGREVSVDGNLETVNGGVSIGSGGSIRGEIRTVNGGIGLDNTEVTGDLITSNGDITLENGSRVTGNLVIRGTKGTELKPPTITVSGTSIVDGDIEIRDEDRGVRLVLIDGGRVTGSTGSAVVERIDEQPQERVE